MNTAQKIVQASKKQGQHWLIRSPRTRKYVAGQLLARWIKTFPRGRAWREMTFTWSDDGLLVRSGSSTLRLTDVQGPTPKPKHLGKVESLGKHHDRDQRVRVRWENSLPELKESATLWSDL